MRCRLARAVAVRCGSIYEALRDISGETRLFSFLFLCAADRVLVRTASRQGQLLPQSAKGVDVCAYPILLARAGMSETGVAVIGIAISSTSLSREKKQP